MRGRANGYVYTGREQARRVCPSCELRFKFGRPVASDTWPAKLTLTRTQLDVLFVAAAEYRDLCGDDPEFYDPISFLDWITVDALTASYVSPVNVSTLERGTFSEKRR